MKNPLTELFSFCRVLKSERRALCDHAGVLDVESVEDIGQEVDGQRVACAALAHKARCADDEGIALVKRLLADGHLNDSEIPALRRALRHFENSQRTDHLLAERLS